MGTFEAFYASPVQHPFALWAVALAAGAWCALHSGIDSRVRRYCLGLTLLSLIDAWATSTHVYGVGTLSGTAASVVPLFFVLAGDWRFLWLVTSATAAGSFEPGGRALASALGLTVLVPISSQLVMWALPQSMSGARTLFLVYELAFVALTLGLMTWHPRLREATWVARVARFVLVYYGLWATADAILLATGADWGFGLRVVPNLLYYGGLIAVIGRESARARAEAGTR